MGEVGLEVQATSIASPEQLPAWFSLGGRDDATFSHGGDTWSCLYRFEGEPFAEVAWDGSMWRIARFWRGRKTGETHAPARLSLSGAISLHFQYLSVEASGDPYEKLLKDRVETTAVAQYWLPRQDGSIVVMVPGGRAKGIVLPLVPGDSARLSASADLLRSRLGARLVLTRAERGFQFVTAKEPDEFADGIVSALSRINKSPVSEPRIAHMDIGATRIWRIQLKQEVDLAYLLIMEHNLLDLIDALVVDGYVPSGVSARQDPLSLVLLGGLVAGLADLVGQSSVHHFSDWLTDMPTALGTFPPIPQGTPLSP